ncbi:MAG: tetratricopeptide repeat protein, partial [Anaerolineae bacterium]|nr:tetratricopeptide repeat protein [Anaerolineae bacterium]
CITLSDQLSDLAGEFASQFIFAKVDIDEQEELRKEYDIKNIPTLKVFVNGKVVATEEGQLVENECRHLLKSQGIFHESDEMRLKARELHLSGETQSAFVMLTEAIKKDPTNTRIALDMVQVFIDSKLIDNANGLYNKLPQSVKNSNMGQSLGRQLTFVNRAAKTDGVQVLQQRLELNENDFDARFDLSVCMIAEYETMVAINHLFYILENNVDYNNGAAKELIIALISILKEKEPEVAKSTQQKLSNVLS